MPKTYIINTNSKIHHNTDDESEYGTTEITITLPDDTWKLEALPSDYGLSAVIKHYGGDRDGWQTAYLYGSINWIELKDGGLAIAYEWKPRPENRRY